ncbi:hypothetical protein KP001_03585 [Geomonas subterranea]|uniref:Uncharacterized protein n=1 Tax=Geomonas subterranea TaxID=2847989 RepID=A0ABX8LHX3_9BACT|nr:hypothetical protein [Geomonas subterranea]QXE91638.1 hypothetical protein KP001_03585 [Geomonas subterranea]QXM10270.1 hypothetical protein KP002_03910 [Geomonas subterranea]
MIQTYTNQSGHTFTSLNLDPIEIYTNSDMEGFYHGNTVTALNGEQFTILDTKCVQGRTYRVLLLPVAQEASHA